MSTHMRVLLAGLFHETHTFLSGVTGLAEFERREGDELRTAEGDGSPLAAILEVGRERGWDIVPVIDLRATPGPTVADEVVDLFWNAFEAAAKREAGRIDGVALVLHGAMVSESCLDVEGEILARIRKLLGPSIPVCGVLDLHGNITQQLADNSHGFIAYRQNPHADAHAAARDGALLLDRCLRTGERPVTVWERPPVMWPPTGTGTAFEPMRRLEALAREFEREHTEILAINVFGGFSFADTPDTGVSFTAVTVGRPEFARGILSGLSSSAMMHCQQGNVLDRPLETVLDEIAAGRLPPGSRIRGPIVLAEPSDNIGGGAPGDGTALLKALVARDVQNAAVAINDPKAVAVLQGLRPGEKRMADLGGQGSPLSGGPLRIELEFVSASDGRFALEDPHSHLASMCGSYFDMGPCVVAKHGGVRVLVTSRRTPPFDLGQWRSQGIVPEELALVGVKAAVAHRKVYDPIARCHFSVETPGPCSSNLKTFPFRHVKRPVFPLDP
jgi:microcystin degradation protein MlrC